MCCLPGFYRQKPPFANRWNSDVCFSLRIWCTAGLACGDFKPELVSMMKSVLENASADIDNEPGKPATSAAKAKMASRILTTVADGVTDAGQIVLGRD